MIFEQGPRATTGLILHGTTPFFHISTDISYKLSSSQ